MTTIRYPVYDQIEVGDLVTTFDHTVHKSPVTGKQDRMLFAVGLDGFTYAVEASQIYELTKKEQA